MKYARNITDSRLILQGGLVVVNGMVNYDYNYIILPNDIIQIYTDRVFKTSVLLTRPSKALANAVNLRYLG